jgi:hypothetical protein
MSEREKCLQIINRMPERQLSHVASVLEAIDEALDDEF